jgi:hypothetical protein
LIDFDARKIPSQKHRVAQLKQRLQDAQFANYSFPEQVQYGGGSHFGGIRQWLNLTGAKHTGVAIWARSVAYHVSNLVNQRHLPFYKLKILRLTPTLAVNWYYRKIKPLLETKSQRPRDLHT